MHLYLTKRSHLNSSYVNEDGHVLYKVETSFKFIHRVATVKRIGPGSPSTIHHSSSSGRDDPPPYEAINDNDIKEGDVEYDEVPDEQVDEKDDIHDELHDDLSLQDKFFTLAEIQFNVIDSSVMRFGGQEYETSHFLDKKGLGFYGCDRVFIGPDGLEYQWSLGRRVPELVRLDSAKTPIARFHRRRLGILKKKRPASLEIFPEGIHMVDLIIITFVYIQKIRNDGEKRAQKRLI